MSNRLAWVLVIILFLVLIATDAGAAECKPTIPDDLVLTCYRGQWVAFSPSSGEAVVWPVPCPAHRQEPERQSAAKVVRVSR